MGNKDDKLQALSEKLVAVALDEGQKSGLEPGDIIRALGTAAVAMTAALAKDGQMPMAMLTLVVAIARDAQRSASLNRDMANSMAEGGEA